jgi:hypothetical protein
MATPWHQVACHYPTLDPGGKKLDHRQDHSTDKTGMSTAETEPAGIDPQVLADLDAVMKRMSDGAAVDPETSRRIEERADRITAEIRRTRRVSGVPSG